MIPVSAPVIGPEERAYVLQALERGEISSSGRFVAEFEERWAAYCGRRFGVAVVNGTAALQLAVALLELNRGDEVILPTFTIISCALAIINAGAVPRLVDSDPRTWCMSVDDVHRAIGRRTRAIMPVHIYGHPVDMDAILDLADRHDLTVIEDAAEAHGAEYRSSTDGRWRRCGSFGAISCFSFYANKLVTTGEGGMLVTDDPQLAERARLLRNLAFEGVRRFRHERAGFNFRMTNLQAALGIPQIARMNEIVAKKRWIAAEYTRRLTGIQGIELQAEEHWARSVHWMYGLVLRADTGCDAETFSRRLTELGVETRPFFLGMHEQPVFRRSGLFAGESYPIAERLARQGLYLPSGLGITAEQIDRVTASVQQALV